VFQRPGNRAGTLIIIFNPNMKKHGSYLRQYFSININSLKVEG